MPGRLRGQPPMFLHREGEERSYVDYVISLNLVHLEPFSLETGTRGTLLLRLDSSETSNHPFKYPSFVQSGTRTTIAHTCTQSETLTKLPFSTRLLVPRQHRPGSLQVRQLQCIGEANQPHRLQRCKLDQLVLRRRAQPSLSIPLHVPLPCPRSIRFSPVPWSDLQAAGVQVLNLDAFAEVEQIGPLAEAPRPAVPLADQVVGVAHVAGVHGAVAAVEGDGNAAVPGGAREASTSPPFTLTLLD